MHKASGVLLKWRSCQPGLRRPRWILERGMWVSNRQKKLLMHSVSFYGENVMHQNLSHYPISALIFEVFEKAGLSRGAFARALQYKNVTKGLRRFDEWLKRGWGEKNFLERLVRAFDISDREIREALVDTEAMILQEEEARREQEEREARARFQPYIYVETSLRIPTSVTMAAFSNCQMKYIELKDVPEKAGYEELLARTKTLLLEHYERKKGQCILFGDITGYRLVHSFDESVRLSIKGEVIERVKGIFRGPTGYLEIKGKRFNADTFRR